MSAGSSIVIVSYNAGDYLRRCLVSIDAHTPGAEVIVVDNASHDGTPEMVAEAFPHVTLVRRTTNAGFSTGANEGLRRARGEHLMLLNPDAELTSDALTSMIAYLREHPNAGILGPRVEDSDGSLQLSCRAFPDLGTALFNRYSLLTRLLPGNRFSSRYLMTGFDHRSIRDVDWLSAACWLMPRRAYETIGPLDEGYFWTLEDVDYCQRAHRAGLGVVYFPQVTVRHHIGRSAATVATRAIVARHRGMARYYRAYLRPRSRLAPLADAAALSAIGARCAAQLAFHRLRERLARD